MTTVAVLRSPTPLSFPMSHGTASLSGGFRGVRVSKFRHVYGQTSRREHCYEGMRTTTSAHDSQFCAVNPKFIAVAIDVAGGGAFQVLPLRWVGKVDYHFGRVSTQGGPITDLQWNPFNDNIIASASDDSTIKLWHIPDEGPRSFVSKWLIELSGHHTRRIAYIYWHPTAENVLASVGFDFKIVLWNVGTGQCLVSMATHPETIYSMSFNQIGDKLVTSCKDKNLRIFNARTGEETAKVICHEGTKPSKVAYLGATGMILTAGFSRSNRRQICLWQEMDLSAPLTTLEIDSSSGVLFPFFDQDLSVVYIAGKGDGNIRYYELSDSQPYLHYLSEFQSRYPQRGFGVMPKRGLKVGQCEIFRLYKLHSTQPLVEPLNFIVPRKSETFQSDLYPPTASPTAACTADEWICGLDRPPVLISLRGVAAVTSKPVTVVKHRTSDSEDDKSLLITADRNNERKFRFLAEVTKPDYRDVTQREDFDVINKERQVREKLSERHGPRQSSGDSLPSSLDSPPLPLQHRMTVGALSTDDDCPTATILSSSPPTSSRSARQFSQQQLPSPNKIRKVHDNPRLVFRGAASMDDEQMRPLSLTEEINRIQVLGKPAATTVADAHSLQPVATAMYLSDGEEAARRRHAATSTMISSPMSLRGDASGASRLPKPTNIPTSMSSQRLTSSDASEQEKKRTRPGNIGPGPLVRNDVSTAHVKPFRIARPKNTANVAAAASESPVSASVTLNGNGGVPISIETTDGTQTELHRMYTSQCRRVRELLTENERQADRIGRLQTEMSRLTQHHDRLLAENTTQREDIKSLRYEIRWKDERIAFLEMELSKVPTLTSNIDQSDCNLNRGDSATTTPDCEDRHPEI